MLRTSSIFLVVTCCMTVSHQAALNADVRDLGHDLNDGSVYWPANAYGFQYKDSFKGKTKRNFWYFAGEFKSADHVSTHVDAPIHFAEGKWSLTEIPADHLVAPGSVIDVSSKTVGNPDYQLTVKDIQDWEENHGSIAGSILLINFGWAKYYSNNTYYLCGPNGSLGPHGNDTSDLHFPGLHPDTSKWIVDNRPTVFGVGLDTPSLDYGPTTDFMSHRTLGANNIYGIENLANLHGLPATGLEIDVLPVKIRGGSGAPARILARIWRKSTDVSPSTSLLFVIACSLLVIVLFLFAWKFVLNSQTKYGYSRLTAKQR